MEPILSIGHILCTLACTQMSTHTHMQAVKLLSAMVDDSTLYIIQMAKDIALVLGRNGTARDKCQSRDYWEASKAYVFIRGN